MNFNLYTFKAKCINVVDGDTIDCVIDVGFNLTTKQRLRLLGVNTPERNQKGYYEASEFVAQQVQDKDVYVETYKTDVFGRYLAVVYLIKEDGTTESLNQLLLNEKLAVPYKR